MVALAKMAAERRALRRSGDGGKRIEHLALSLAGEKYAVPIAHVGEILRVPRSPRFLELRPTCSESSACAVAWSRSWT